MLTQITSIIEKQGHRIRSSDMTFSTYLPYIWLPSELLNEFHAYEMRFYKKSTMVE